MTRIRRLLPLPALLALAAGCTDEPLGSRSIEMSLAYEDTTNWGPTDATGTASIETTTGEVVISVQGLPMLSEDEYEGWLAGGGEAPISTGKFNTDTDGHGSSRIVLGDISETSFERVVLTVEPVPDPSPAPDARHSIGGFIPPVE